MALRLRLDRRAVADLDEIRDYIAADNLDAAERVRLAILAAADRLSEFPKLGRATGNSRIRVWPLNRYPYLIFYTVGEVELTVLHIRHGAHKPIDPDEL